MNTIRNICLTPVWVFQIFWTTKSFSANPVLGSSILNRMGLHVIRLVLAHGVVKWRRFWLRPLADPDLRGAFQRDGFLVLDSYLEADAFEALARQAQGDYGQVRECVQGNTLTHRVLLDDEALDRFPACHALVERPGFERLLKFCAGHLKRPLYYTLSVKNGFGPGQGDPQKVLHSDTFHATVKAWFFLEDIDADKGPFTYVPGSHRLTRKRLIWEYRRSMVVRSMRDGYSEKGSMRVEEGDLEAMGLSSPRAFLVKRNTLVIADTHGFHCRGQATGGSSRAAIWAFSRTNPFNPFPGLGLRLFSRIENAAAKKYWDYLDRRAAKKGALSSWHPVSADRLQLNLYQAPTTSEED